MAVLLVESGARYRTRARHVQTIAPSQVQMRVPPDEVLKQNRRPLQSGQLGMQARLGDKMDDTARRRLLDGRKTRSSLHSTHITIRIGTPSTQRCLPETTIRPSQETEERKSSNHIQEMEMMVGIAGLQRN